MNTRRTYISLAIVTCFIIGAFVVALTGRKNTASSVVATNNSTQPVDTTATTKTTPQTTDDDTVVSTPKPVKTVPKPQTTPTPTPVADTSKKSRYIDGTYSVTAYYDSPAGSEGIGVSVTLKNDIVTSSTVTPMANDRTSSRYQQRFISGYQSYVIGQNIDTINLDVVSGSSLTPIGFNDALAQIKAKAKS